MPINPNGRPRSLTHKKQQELLNHIAHGGTVEEAAKIVGVSIRTVQREAKYNEHFDHDLQLAQHAAPPDPEKLMQRAARSHWRAAAWLLERTDPDRYGKRSPNSCSPQNVYDIASWFVETALESVPPEHRELLYRRMQAVADKALDLLMPHPEKIRCLTRALADRPTPLSFHERHKTLPSIGDCDPSVDYVQIADLRIKRQAARTPQAICTTKPGDAAISDADFARRLTLLERNAEPYRPKDLPVEYRNYATPDWKLEQAAPSAEEGAAGALWDQGNEWLAGYWEDGKRLPDEDFEEGAPLEMSVVDQSVVNQDEVGQGVLSPKMHETTKPPTAKPNATKPNATELSSTNNDVPTNVGAVNVSLPEDDAAKARSWLDRFRTRGNTGHAA